MNPSRVHTPAGQVGWGGSCMALYNVESPGGYMNTGLSIPGVDILGFKPSYSPDRPWLFDDFDQITFREVSESEHESLLAQFDAGHYAYEYDDCTFDLAEHNRLLEATREEVKAIREKQKVAQTKMAQRENELLMKWRREKEEGKVKGDEVEELLNDPTTHALTAPLTANVWKILVSPTDKITTANQTLSILEAMKLEIPVKSDEQTAGMVVEKILVEPGEVVEAGGTLMILRRKEG